MAVIYSRRFGPPISFSAWKRLSRQLARAWRRGCAPARRFWCTDPKVILSDILPLFEIPSSFPFSQRLRVPPDFCILDEKSSPTYDCCNQRTNFRQLRDYFDGRLQAIYKVCIKSGILPYPL